MPEAKPNEPQSEESEESSEEDAQLSGDQLDLDGLKSRGDVQGLLTLAKAYRAGSAPGGRDMKRCFAAYQAAAELGSSDAEYAVALFCMSGGVVTQDLKEGATRLRAAAEKGSVPAKVYLGNLYELGIHYKADPEKADVWYRNAARGARIEAEAGTDEYAKELAELGCARYVLALVESGKADGDDDKARLLQRARAHGYGLRMKDDLMASDRPTFLDALNNAEGSGGGGTATNSAAGAPISAQTIDLGAAGAAAGKPGGERQAKTTTPDTKTAKAEAEAAKQAKERLADEAKAKKKKAAASAGPSQTNIALGAFGYAMLFAITGLGAGYAATLGARELVSHGTPLPGLGMRTHLVFPIVLALIGVLPTWLVYRLDTVIKALVIGGVFGGIGWVAWGTGQAALNANRAVQGFAFGLAGFLAALLVLGLIGGTKRQPPRPKRSTQQPTS